MRSDLTWKAFWDNFDEMESTMNLNKTDLERAARERNVPGHLIEGLVAYAVDHRPTGGFLEAVLSNNLKESIKRADATSLAGIVPLVSFVIHYLPYDCQGSPEKVAAWLAPREVAP